jgi:hypothetical protein
VEAARFGGVQRICASAGTEFGVPKRFTGINVADACDVGLVEKEFFEGAPGVGKEFRKMLGRESPVEGIHTESGESGAGVRGIVELDPAEVAAVGETENAAIKLEGNVHVDAIGLIGKFREFFCAREPHELAIEFEVKSDDGLGEFEPKVFAFAADGEDFLILGDAGEGCRRLGLCGDGVEDVDATDAAALNERAEGAANGFYFRKFRHGR